MAVYGGDTRIVPPADGDITRFEGAWSQEQISGDVQVEIKSSNVASLPTLGTFSQTVVHAVRHSTTCTSAFDGDQVQGNWNLILLVEHGVI